MAEWISEQRRIIGRKLNGKKLPDFVYRQDSRSPDEIRSAGGFQPYVTTEDVDIIDHVNGSIRSGQNQGQQAKHLSRWVSTGSYRMLNPLDPVIANRLGDAYIYRINTRLANSNEFYDVNDVFDRAGAENIHRTQREWVKENGVPLDAIVGFMKSRDAVRSFGGTDEAPDEAAAGWIVPTWQLGRH